MDKKYILARNLRQNQTPQEQKLWSILRNRQLCNLKFKRQYPIGNYIVDFVCKERKIIIEVDGGQHNSIDIIAYDEERTKYLKSLGFKVIRFWNNEIDDNMEGIYAKLKELLE